MRIDKTAFALALTLAASAGAARADGTAQEWLAGCEASEALGNDICVYYATGVRDTILVANRFAAEPLACIPSHLSGEAVYQTAISAMRTIVTGRPDMDGRAALMASILFSYPCE